MRCWPRGIEFKNLGLLIIDEEQHFGVVHKERLKQLREDVHVLTLTATPIPRTLQLALTGVRELSLITTPPVDRLAVRSFITPFDPVILNEALLRERYRGGQTFYVAPRISDLDEIATFLAETVPDLRVARAHGQMAPGTLDDIMTAFYEGQYDVLLSTTIVESGLDVPNANTLIIHRSDMFGLAQLYQLKGRVGRSKVRAYAYFTVRRDHEDDRGRGEAAEGAAIAGYAGRRVLARQPRSRYARRRQSAGPGTVRPRPRSRLRTLPVNAGRGDRQHQGRHPARSADKWSPQISIGTAVQLPEKLRLGSRSPARPVPAAVDHGRPEEMDAFAAELVDRFGPMPDEVKYLLDVIGIKLLCRAAGVAQVDAGPRGVTVAFRHKKPPNAEAVIRFAREHAELAKLSGDGKLTWKGELDKPELRLRQSRALVRRLAELAVVTGKKAA